MDSNEKDGKSRKNVHHPQTIRRWRRSLESALDEEIQQLQGEMSSDSNEIAENQEETNKIIHDAEGPSLVMSTSCEWDNSVETHATPTPTLPMPSTSRDKSSDGNVSKAFKHTIDDGNLIDIYERLCTLMQFSNSSASSTSSCSSEDDEHHTQINYHYQDTVSAQNLDSSDSSSDEASPQSFENLPGSPHPPTHSFENCKNFNVKALQEYFSNDQEIMFKESQLKIPDVMLMIFSYSVRFSLSYKARRGLIEMAKTFAGSAFSQWDISDYYLSQIFYPPDSAIVYNFYCPDCCLLLEEPTTKKNFKKHVRICEKCSTQFTLSMDSPNYFVSIDLKYQLTSLLSSDKIKEALFTNLNNIKSNTSDSGIMRDIYDGLLYKQLRSSLVFSASNLLTFIFNTDGAALFHSSKQSFWPILVIINELPSHLRFRYPLLAGLWICKKEPSPEEMNLFMRFFIEQCKDLSCNGFLWEDNITGEKVHFILKALLCTVDSVARAIIQNRVQYNGYYGCSWCCCFGKYVGGSIRFLMEEKEASDRTHLMHLKYMARKRNKSKTGGSQNLRKEVKGVKGYSVFTELNDFDMVWSFPRDYLHSDLIGVVSHLWSTWINPKSPIRLSKGQIDQINHRLVMMTPPHEVHRLVRPLTEKAKWKASEWRSFMLFYAIPCLHGIIEDHVLKHLALFVNSMHTLLQESVTQEDLEQVNRDLHLFVGMYEVLYGEEFVTFNVHTLKHLIFCVMNGGPIWATSTFPFENAIFYLKQCVHSPKGIFQQMAKRTLQANICQSIIEEVADEKRCKDYCQSLFARNEVSTFYRAPSDNIVFLGRGMNDPKYDKLSQTGSKTLIFERCVANGMVINSVQYERAIKSDNTTFALENGNFVQVLNLILCEEKGYAEVMNFEVETMVLSSSNKTCIFEKVAGENVVCKTLVKVKKRLNADFIPISFLKEKCVVIKVDRNIYISKLPKTFEIQ